MSKAYCPMKISRTVLHCRATFDILGTILDKANQGGLKKQDRDGHGEKEYDSCVTIYLRSLNEEEERQ